MIFVGSLRHFVIIGKTYVAQLHPWRRNLIEERARAVGVPHVDEAVASAASGQDLLVGVPLGEENATLVLLDNLNAGAVG